MSTLISPCPAATPGSMRSYVVMLYKLWLTIPSLGGPGRDTVVDNTMILNIDIATVVATVTVAVAVFVLTNTTSDYVKLIGADAISFRGVNP